MKEGVAFFDDHGRLLLSNRRFAEIYSLGGEDVAPGVPILDLIRREFAANGQPGCAAASPAKTRGAYANARVRIAELRNGRRVEIRERSVPDVGWVSTHRDVTAVDEHSAVAAERLSLQKLIDLVPDNLWIKDAESRFVIANDATARRMGYTSSADLIGKTDLELCPAETARKYLADERRIIATGEPLIDCEEYVIASERRKVLDLHDQGAAPRRRRRGRRAVRNFARHHRAQAGRAAARRSGEILEMIATSAPLDRCARPAGAAHRSTVDGVCRRASA